MSQATEEARSKAGSAAEPLLLQADWELDYYSRPILEPDGKKRWELLICSTPVPGSGNKRFRFALNCSASSVNSQWLKQALEQAVTQAADEGFAPPRKLRCWRASMRTMVQRAAEQLGLELIPHEHVTVQAVYEALVEAGFLTGYYSAGNVLRFDPALVMERDDITDLLAALENILEG